MLLGNRYTQAHAYVHGTLTLYGAAFQQTQTSHELSYCARRQQPPHNPSHNPVTATPVRYHTTTVWPHPISLATTLGITIVFSSYGY